MTAAGRQSVAISASGHAVDLRRDAVVVMPAAAAVAASAVPGVASMRSGGVGP